ncbi:hypothetical protein IG631_17965 [Alternaria alternata]|nr:hypothetical protein IG631_17965 [Alternaria alternata]
MEVGRHSRAYLSAAPSPFHGTSPSMMGVVLGEAGPDIARSMNADTNSVTMVSIIRLYTLDNIANSTDISFDNVDHATLSAVEVNVGIICACIPAMRPLFALLAPHYFSAVPQYTNARILDIERQKQRTGRQGNTRPTTATPRTRPNTARTTIIRPTTTTTIRTRPSTARTTMTRPGTATHVTRPSTARTTTRSSTSHTLKLETTIPRADSVQSDIPLQPLVPTLSRTPSGRFSVANSSRPPTLRLPSYNNHSRNASGSSQSTQSSTRGRSATRFQGRPDPLRMSPITPFSPPWPAPLRTGSPLALGSHTRHPSSQRAPSPLPPRTPGADKQLPLTPFPVGSGD